MPIVQAKCESCGGILAVDSNLKAANCPFCGTAYVVQDSINYYNTTMNISAGVVNIYGEGKTDFEIIGGALVAYKGSTKKVMIPDNVSIIGDNAFCGCKGITEVIIPNSVVRIGKNAFKDCQMLKEIKIPDRVVEIDVEAFCGDRNIRFIWPESWTNRHLSKLLIVARSENRNIYISSNGIPANSEITLLYTGGNTHEDKYYFYEAGLFFVNNNQWTPLVLSNYAMTHDVQNMYNDLALLLDRASISRSVISIVDVTCFAWKQGFRRSGHVPHGTAKVNQIKIMTN